MIYRSGVKRVNGNESTVSPFGKYTSLDISAVDQLTNNRHIFYNSSFDDILTSIRCCYISVSTCIYLL